MSTSSLAKQLTFLKERDAQTSRVTEKRQATILFDAKEAGKIDIDQIQSLAIEGYHNLTQIQPNLVNHQQTIFENKFIDRMKLTRAENEALSTKLMALIRELSKNLLNTNTMKILEYLLRNYQVYLFEGEYLVVAFLPFHQTPQFVKLIQNVDLSSKTSRLHFLNANSLTGQPIPREMLLRQLLLDPSLVENFKDYLTQCLEESNVSGTRVFIPSALRASMVVKAPALAFLVSLISESLATGNRRHSERFKLVGLKAIRDFCRLKADEEGFSASLLILTDLITARLIDNELLQATLSDIASVFIESSSVDVKLRDEVVKPSLAKCIVYAFQHLVDLEYSEELAALVEDHLIGLILESKCRLVQMAIKMVRNYCSVSVTNEQLDTLKQTLTNIIVNDQTLIHNKQNVLRFVAVLYKMALSGKNNSKVTQVLKDVFGQEFYEAASILLTSSELSEDMKSRIEKTLEESVIHKLVEINNSSKISLIVGLRHPSSAIKISCLHLLLKSELEAILQPSIVREIFNELASQYDVDYVLELLKYPFSSLTLTEEQANVLFDKYLSIDSQEIRASVKQLAAGQPELKKKFEVIDLLSGKSKAFKKQPELNELVIKTIKQVSPYMGKTVTFNAEQYANALLGQKNYSLFNDTVTLLCEAYRAGSPDLFSSFSINFSASMASLDLPDLIAALRTITQFKAISPDLVYKARDETTFLKMMLILFFSDEYALDIGILGEIGSTLGALNDLSIKDIQNLDHMLLILLLKGLRNEQLKNGHFLKILQTTRFSVKKEVSVGLQLFKHLLKRLIARKFEFESGSFDNFLESDLKNVKDYLQDSKNQGVPYLKEFFRFCVATPSFYPDFVKLIGILDTIKFAPEQLVSFLPELLPKIDMSSEHRQSLIRALYDLHCLGSTVRSTTFENYLVKLRALVDIPFQYLKSKSSNQGYLELIQIYMESNFKSPGLIEEIEVEPSKLIQLSNQVVSKQHEGLLGSLCLVLKHESQRAQSLEALGSLLLTYKLLYSTLVGGKIKKDETELSIVYTLTAVHNCLTTSEHVKIVTDKSAITTGLSSIEIAAAQEPSSEPKKKTLQTTPNAISAYKVDTVTDAKSTKLVVTVSELFKPDIYAHLQERNRLAIEHLVAIKFDRLHDEVEDESLDKFTFVKAVIEYLLRTNKEMMPQVNSLVQSMLQAFAAGIDSVRQRLHQGSKKAPGKGGFDLERQVDETNAVLITKLHHEIDHLLLKIMKIIATQFGNNKLRIVSEVFLFWLLLSEKYRNNSLIRLLTNFYIRAEKKGLSELNPLTDPEIFYCSRYIRSATHEIFGIDNTDVVINLLIALYVFNTAEGEGKTKLNFKHYCHFMIFHLLDKQDELLAGCNNLLDTLNSGISTLKGFLPTPDKKISKIKKSKIVKELLKRSDPFVPESVAANEKARSMRFCLIYLAFVNMVLKDRRFNKYLQAAILAQNADYRQSALMAKLESLLLESFKFDTDFEVVERGYQTSVKSKKENVLILFDKIRKLCALNVQSISEMIPIELFPLAINGRLEESDPDFSIMLRLCTTLVDRLEGTKLTNEFYEYFEQTLLRFTANGQFLVEDTGSSNPLRKFVQSMFTALGQLHKKAPSKTEDLANKQLPILLEIASKQGNPIVQAGCLGALSFFSRGLNDAFVSLLDVFMLNFEKLILRYFQQKQFAKLETLQTLKPISSQKSLLALRKVSAKEISDAFSTSDVVNAWLNTASILTSNLGNMLEPYATRMVLYAAFAHECIGDLKAKTRDFLKSMIIHIDERLMLTPLQSLADALGKGSLMIEGVPLLTQSLDIKNICSKFESFEPLAYESSIDTAVKLIAAFALKSSESTFKSHFEALVKWSKITHDYTAESEEMMERKLIMVKILNNLIRSIGRFGINYYGPLFDYFVGFLEHCLIVGVPQKSGKRASSNLSDKFVALHALIMESLDLLFKNDKKGFVDTLRFEKLLKPLVGQLHLTGLSEDFYTYATASIMPPIMSLVSLVSDDYMWKNILYQICIQLRTDSIVVRKVVASTCMKFIDLLADKSVIILNDFLQYLSEMLDDEEVEVSAMGRSLVRQLGQYTSEDIFALIKAST